MQDGEALTIHYQMMKAEDKFIGAGSGSDQVTPEKVPSVKINPLFEIFTHQPLDFMILRLCLLI